MPVSEKEVPNQRKENEMEDISEEEYLERRRKLKKSLNNPPPVDECHFEDEIIEDQTPDEEELPEQDFGALFLGMSEPAQAPVSSDSSPVNQELTPQNTISASLPAQPQKPASIDPQNYIPQATGLDALVENFSKNAKDKLNDLKDKSADKAKNLAKIAKDKLNDLNNTKEDIQDNIENSAEDTHSIPPLAPENTQNDSVTPVESKPARNRTIVVVISIVAAVLIVAGVAIGLVVSNNNAIADLMTQATQKENDIQRDYTDCTFWLDYQNTPNSLYIKTTPNEYEAISYSKADFNTRLQELNAVEANCRQEKEDKLKQAELLRQQQETARLEAEKQALEAQKRALEAQQKAVQVQEREVLAAANDLREQQNAFEQQQLLAAAAQQQEQQPMAQSNRLSPVRAVKYERLDHYSWVIFYDNLLNKPCQVITNSKYPIMQQFRWCIPFGGSDDDLSDTFAGSIAMDYDDRKKCKKNGALYGSPYCEQMFNALQEQANRENWASLAEICKTTTDATIKTYCGYLY